MLDVVAVSCPYCGEPLDLMIDGSAGDQQYTEDCQVCCQPMVVRALLDEQGLPSVEVFREDDAF